MRKPLIAANWKMHKTIPETQKMLEDLKARIGKPRDKDVVVCPPYTSLTAANAVLAGSGISLGAQNFHWEAQGAFTGEVSSSMLKELGVTHVIVGHSERRQYFAETNETVNKKMKAAFKEGLTPIVCVGETLNEREKNLTEAVVTKQVRESVLGLDKIASLEKLVLAYEPVWAIGTGRTATPEQAQEVHALIRSLLAQLVPNSSNAIRILYGGSVKPDNMAELMRQADIDGGLVGGASLEAESFSKIVDFDKKEVAR